MSINNRSNIETKREAFWNGYSAFLSKHNASFNFSTPNIKGYINTPLPISDHHLSARANFGRKKDNVQALIDLPSDKFFFNLLVSKRNEIENEFGGKLRWEKANSRWNILVGIDVDLWNQKNWEGTYQWLMEKMMKLDQVFRKRFELI